MGVTILKRVDFGTETYSVHRLLDDYATSPFIDVFESLPPLSATKQTTCFTLSLTAAALVSSARQFSQSCLFVQARRAYLTALSSLKKTIATATSLRDDSQLMVLYLLGFFEYTVESLPNAEAAKTIIGCHPRETGVLALMPLRVRCGWDTALDRSIVIFSRHIRLMKILVFHWPLESLTADFEESWTTWKNFPPMEIVIRDAVYSVHQIRQALSTADVHVDTLRNMTQKTLLAMRSLRAAASNVERTPAEAPFTTAFDGLLTIASRTSALIASSLYLTVRIQLCESLHQLLSHCPIVCGTSQVGPWPQDAPTARDCIHELWQLISSAVAIESGMLSNLEGPKMVLRILSLFWPVVAIIQSAAAPPDMKLAAVEILRWNMGTS